MAYLQRPNSHFDRCIILLKYIVREAFFAVCYDGPSLNTRTNTLSVIQRVAEIPYAQYST